MEYLKLFDTHTQYESYIGGDPSLPNVSHCIQEDEVHYNPYDYSRDYLTFEALQSGTFKFSGSTGANTLEYSLDNGETWTTLAHNTNTPTITAGSNILWKGEGLTINTNSGIGKFVSSNTFNVKGNIMSLIFGDSFSGQTSLSGKNNAYMRLFSGCTKVISAENLSLPATTLADSCYSCMFLGCAGLITSPELPATTSAVRCYESMFEGCGSLTSAPALPITNLSGSNYCYQGMFRNCTSLTSAPALPATTLASSCYTSMFYGCTGLTVAPSLPATALTQYCYDTMFGNCSGLTSTPSLPATTLANYCYNNMFAGCTSLVTAPELPVTALTNYCYYGMFSGCTSLTTAPALPATTLMTRCYSNMFANCSGLTSAPVLPAITLVANCYTNMFSGCTNLTYIKAMFTTTPSTSYTNSWVNGVSSTGTFVKNSAAEWNVTGVNGIPTNWTVQTASS